VKKTSTEAGVEAAEMILKMKLRPDGLFVANDNCAVGCMITLKENGILIPEQMAIVGFNNDPVSLVIEPHLTTINYRGYEMGEVAARHLINHLNGTSLIRNTNTILLRSELIIRASSQKNKTPGKPSPKA
jgi:LacI family transcriptional regulator